VLPCIILFDRIQLELEIVHVVQDRPVLVSMITPYSVCSYISNHGCYDLLFNLFLLSETQIYSPKKMSRNPETPSTPSSNVLRPHIHDLSPYLAGNEMGARSHFVDGAGRNKVNIIVPFDYMAWFIVQSSERMPAQNLGLEERRGL
jgi:hypothetical protein